MTGEQRLTLPVETGMDDGIKALMIRLGADAVRNSDGTELPEWVVNTAAKVYSTYFPSRGDEAWAEQVPGERVCQFLMSEPVTATSKSALEINVMKGYLAAQFAPDLDADLGRYWQVIDRTTGEVIASDRWSVKAAAPLPATDTVRLVGDIPKEARSAVVTIIEPEPFHVYTVNFLARQIWDSTQIYNYLTNNWALDPKRNKDRTFDVAYGATWNHVQKALRDWLEANPKVDVVRFTTFFYHFTLVFDDQANEKYVDWFGYSAAVSIPALEEFAKEYGYQLTPEDFVDGGYYNTPFRLPSKKFRDWIDFTSKRVAEKAKVLVKSVHEAGREAMMFLGDNWIGTEPYGPHFESIGLDSVVGSVGSAATCRMISDIPGVKYTEGRFLPYFFPDVFHEGGDPTKEADESWLAARRAIVRSPLDRIGYGGYLSLAMQFPSFIDRIESIINEFRSIHDESGGERPQNATPVVAVLNAWGSLRTWQTHMVAHALWYKQIYSYLGVIESLAGLPFEVRFISFGDVTADAAALDEIDVVINAGAIGSAFSGGDAWNDVKLQERIRSFVYEGGGFIGVGAPTARNSEQGSVFALFDVLGVEMENGWSLSEDKYLPKTDSEHFVTEDLQEDFDFGEDAGDVFSVGANVLYVTDNDIRIAVNQYGKGRSIYLAGLPYSTQNARLLHRGIMWSAGIESQWNEVLSSTNPAVEVAWYPAAKKYFAYNNLVTVQSTRIRGNGIDTTLTLEPMEGRWVDTNK